MNYKSILFSAALFFEVPFLASAQSAVSKVVHFTLEDVSDMFMPPELYVDIEFKDANGNQILEATEKGEIGLKITNKGGKADNVKISVMPEDDFAGITMPLDPIITSISSNGSYACSFPIEADTSVETRKCSYKIIVQEPMGFDINAVLVLPTFEFQKPKLHLNGVSNIIDSGKGLRAMNGNPDGKVQKGDVVKVTLAVQNVGMGEAENVRYVIESKDPNVLLLRDDGAVKTMDGGMKTLMSGQSDEITFRMSVNNNYASKSRYLPIYVHMVEKSGFGTLSTTQIPITLGESPDDVKYVDIKGNQEKLMAQQQAKVYSDDNRITSHMKIRDISLAPFGSPIYNDAIAIVLGAEKNSYGTAPAPYAARDAELMSRYFRDAMGVRKENVYLKTDAEITKSALDDIFNPKYGILRNRIEEGKTDVFVYYSGHGMPEIDDDGQPDVYMFPYDARREYVKERGYSLNKLYDDLNSLGAKSVTVILDACFSGSSRSSQNIRSENIAMAKGVVISDFSSRPWEVNPNFRLFTSSTGSETSLGNDLSQSGLFTYYLACGMQGDADLNEDGVITMAELVSFVTENVHAEAQKVRSTSQTPQYYGNGDFIIERIK